jgi:hypothetical protein
MSKVVDAFLASILGSSAYNHRPCRSLAIDKDYRVLNFF